jgi:molybdopterin-guanine dinucleotide biosynthesis protein A
MNKSKITAVILSGGQSSRMLGEDKGLILLNNSPLISYVINEVNDKVDSILVSANRNIDLYQKFGRVIPDNSDGFQGPLAGISAALKVVKTQYLLVLPCDSPFIKDILIKRLNETMRSNDCDICVASEGKNMQPVFSLIKSSLRDDLEKFLKTGERKLRAWYENNNTIQVDFSDYKDMFININSKKDLNKYN